MTFPMASRTSTACESRATDLANLMAYLVDTDIMVDFTRGNAQAADYLDSIGEACLLSAITALESIGGARSQQEVADLDIMISAYERIPPTNDVTRRAYHLMKTYAKSAGLRTLDSLIAATDAGRTVLPCR
jgi:predicted nucleic acid-binding protein